MHANTPNDVATLQPTKVSDQPRQYHPKVDAQHQEFRPVWVISQVFNTEKPLEIWYNLKTDGQNYHHHQQDNQHDEKN